MGGMEKKGEWEIRVGPIWEEEKRKRRKEYVEEGKRRGEGKRKGATGRGGGQRRQLIWSREWLVHSFRWMPGHESEPECSWRTHSHRHQDSWPCTARRAERSLPWPVRTVCRTVRPTRTAQSSKRMRDHGLLGAFWSRHLFLKKLDLLRNKYNKKKLVLTSLSYVE